jgi:hypothetical protein
MACSPCDVVKPSCALDNQESLQYRKQFSTALNEEML